VVAVVVGITEREEAGEGEMKAQVPGIMVEAEMGGETVINNIRNALDMKTMEIIIRLINTESRRMMPWIRVMKQHHHGIHKIKEDEVVAGDSIKEDEAVEGEDEAAEVEGGEGAVSPILVSTPTKRRTTNQWQMSTQSNLALPRKKRPPSRNRHSLPPRSDTSKGEAEGGAGGIKVEEAVEGEEVDGEEGRGVPR